MGPTPTSPTTGEGGLARFDGDARQANLALVAVLRRIAAERGATPSQVALAWLRHRGTELGLPVVAIPGTRQAARVEENLGSLEVNLDAEAMQALGRLADTVIGRRSDHDSPDWVSDTRE